MSWYAVLLQVAGEQIVRESLWTPAMVTSVGGVLVALVTALTAMFVTLLQMKKEAAVSRAHLSADVAEVHGLVNAGNSALLEQIERLTGRIADITGDKADRTEADAATHNVSEKARITEEAKVKREASDAAVALEP